MPVGARRHTWGRTPCTVNDCRCETVADLYVYKRKQAPDGSYPPNTHKTMAHVFLCNKHYEEMMVFLDTLEEK